MFLFDWAVGVVTVVEFMRGVPGIDMVRCVPVTVSTKVLMVQCEPGYEWVEWLCLLEVGGQDLSVQVGAW